MPAYDFKCKTCSEIVEVNRSATDDSPVPCPKCGGDTKMVFHPVGVHFKGSGFHNTDYKSRSADTAGDPAGEPAAPAPCSSAGSKPACDGCPAAD
jgi:putative FmdB family regulatory protein